MYNGVNDRLSNPGLVNSLQNGVRSSLTPPPSLAQIYGKQSDSFYAGVIVFSIVQARTFKSVGNAGFRSFTKSNFRYNLQVLTGQSGIGMDAHHIFPKAAMFANFFKRVGINVHDPKNLVWWESKAHQKVAQEYNKAWAEFIRNNPKATTQQTYEFGNSLMKKYGF
ncbi:hypothetical protein D3C80_1293610 [compost metagenome]